MIRVFAELRYEKYTALVDAGFSEKQALEIIIGTRRKDYSGTKS